MPPEWVLSLFFFFPNETLQVYIERTVLLLCSCRALQALGHMNCLHAPDPMPFGADLESSPPLPLLVWNLYLLFILCRKTLLYLDTWIFGRSILKLRFCFTLLVLSAILDSTGSEALRCIGVWLSAVRLVIERSRNAGDDPGSADGLPSWTSMFCVNHSFISERKGLCWSFLDEMGLGFLINIKT